MATISARGSSPPRVAPQRAHGERGRKGSESDDRVVDSCQDTERGQGSTCDGTAVEQRERRSERQGLRHRVGAGVAGPVHERGAHGTQQRGDQRRHTARTQTKRKQRRQDRYRGAGEHGDRPRGVDG